MQQPFIAGAAVEPTSTVEIAIKATNLPDKDVLSKSDPFVVTYVAEPGLTTWREFHRTEVIRDTLNPEFASKLILTYHFEVVQKLRFEVFDHDADTTRLSSHDFLGAAECTLGQLVSSGGLSLTLASQSSQTPFNRLSSRKGSSSAPPAPPAGGSHNPNLPTLHLVAEELQSSKQVIELAFSGRKLHKRSWFSSPNPFLEIHKSLESGEFSIAHRGEVVRGSVNPVWKSFTIKGTTLCNADLDRSLKFKVFDWSSSGTHVLIGEFYTTARTLLEGPGRKNVYEVINEATKARKSGYKHSGEILLTASKMTEIASFLDYIRGGTELHCTIAIDFTASNGDPKDRNSLHNVTMGRPNQYEQAITAVGDIIRDYDSDKMFPVLGFGARLPPDGRVSHEFFVNMTDNPYCVDITGVLGAYKNCINLVQLYGPTNFAPVINHVGKFATAYQDGSRYFILLIITDGVITDMPQTKEAIVSASGLPLSIIIVGVGGADFEAMETLDADVVPLTSRGRTAARDIVQFVPMRKFMAAQPVLQVAGLPPQKRSAEMAALAREVLAEIPAQFLGYMMSRGYEPQPPRHDVVNVPVDPEVLSGPLTQVQGFASGM